MKRQEETGACGVVVGHTHGVDSVRPREKVTEMSCSHVLMQLEKGSCVPHVSLQKERNTKETRWKSCDWPLPRHHQGDRLARRNRTLMRSANCVKDAEAKPGTVHL